MQTTPTVAIIGTGLAGLGMAIRLKEAGFSDFIIFEKAGRCGGVWRDNTYPGAACDVPSHLYSFSFEPKAEMVASIRHAARDLCVSARGPPTSYGLRPHIPLQHRGRLRRHSTKSSRRWQIEAVRRRPPATPTFSCRRLDSSTDPPIPASQAWRASRVKCFTRPAGTTSTTSTGKRVAVIGTGASAIQFVPQVAPKVAELTLFQRNAAHVIPQTRLRLRAMGSRKPSRRFRACKDCPGGPPTG